MWQCVKDLIDDVIDELWPELEHEVKVQFHLVADDPYVIIPDKTPKTFCSGLAAFFCCPWRCIRNWYLYSTSPCIFIKCEK